MRLGNVHIGYEKSSILRKHKLYQRPLLSLYHMRKPQGLAKKCDTSRRAAPNLPRRRSKAEARPLKQRILVPRAVASEKVVNIFAVAGLKKPDILILSYDLLQEVRQLPHRNVAVGLLGKLLNKVLRDETLKNIAQELVVAVRRSVTIDWTVREYVRAQVRVIVKRILHKYGYPPGKQKKAIQTVSEHAEVLCNEWVNG